jgi:DNA-binding NtrC family response regulator
MIDKVAQTEARVLITGPNGTGKELVAHQLHERSERQLPWLLIVLQFQVNWLKAIVGHVKGI